MAELFKVNAPVRKPLFEGVQGENEARSIQFDITPWVEELGDGAVTATAKRSQDSQPYPVTVTKDGTTVTWKPTSTDTAFAGVGSFQLEYTVDDVLAKTCIWSTMVAPSLDPAGDPPDPYDNWLAEMREIAADAIQAADDAEDSAENAEAWTVGQRGGVDVPSTDPTYENNSKYWAEQSLANQYGAYIVKSASGNIASFNDGADDVPMKSVNVTITPKQSGSGDPSPSNVRTITGWTDADVKQTIGNIWSGSLRRGYYAFSNGAYAYVNTWATTDIIDIGEAEKVSVRSAGTTDWVGFVFFDANGSFISSSTNAPSGLPEPITTEFTANVPSNARKIAINLREKINTVIEIANFSDLIVTKGEITTTPVPLGQTVYGGTVDVISGELKITHALKQFTGGFAKHPSLTNAFYLNSAFTDAGAGEALSNMVKYNNVAFGSLGDNEFTIDTSYTRLALKANGFATAEEFNAFVADNPLVVVYPLATPTAVQLTPTHVATLLGTNNVWSDAGDVAVEYRADPTLAYAELEALILENI